MRIVLCSGYTLELSCRHQFTHQDIAPSLDALPSVVGELHLLLVESHAVTIDGEHRTRTQNVGVETLFLERVVLCQPRLYRAVKRICKEEKLSAVTLSCFKIIEQIGTTGCLALAMLNDEGILAGCEGDLQSIFTLLAAKALTGKAGFMANPSMINARTNEIILAHCTVGLKQTEKYVIRNHFETETGIGIQGILPTGDVTILKCGGECLDEYYLSTGTLTENTNYINMCRTQVRVKLDTPADYFLKNPLGNHHILIHGNYETVLNEFLQANSCKRTE